MHVYEGVSQLNKQALSLNKLSGFFKQIASIQGAMQFHVQFPAV